MNNIVKRNPATLSHNDIANWLLSPWGDFATSGLRANYKMWHPFVDLEEQKNSYILVANIPGVDAKDIEINIENNVLTISGKRENEHQENHVNYTKKERFNGKFYRTFKLPLSIDVDNIKAKSENGVLTITLPKQKSSKTRRIKID